jgi:Domain of unknown function (DUF4382)
MSSRVFRLLSVCLCLSACNGVLGGNDTGQVEVRLTNGAIGPAPGASALGVSASTGAYAAIDPTDVTSLVVTVTDIQFRPLGDAGDGWQSLGLGSPVDLDLAALPTVGQSPLVIAAGTLDVGDYASVRLMATEGVIEFGTQVNLGQGTHLPPGQYDVVVPSGGETGIKTDVSFTVTSDGQGGTNSVDLLFDEGATYLNVTATGNGEISLAPVIHSKP